MPIDVVLGLQWGDEGKGKIVDKISDRYDYVARFQGGPNAGHTLVIEGVKYVLHQIPSGIFRPNVKCIIGNGAIVNPIILKEEIEKLNNSGLDCKDRLILSNKSHIILPTHHLIDKFHEERREQVNKEKRIGSTLKGISPTYQDKSARIGIRMGEILSPSFKERAISMMDYHLQFLPEELHAEAKSFHLGFLDACNYLKSFHILSAEKMLHTALKDKKEILAEGAQGSLLDLDFGSYPFVTSSQTTAGGVCTGLGVPPTAVRKIFGVFKAYATRVGNGPFPTELHDRRGEKLREIGKEYGATTGRLRRCGWLDIPALKYTIALNGVTDLVITKLDVLGQMDEIEVANKYNIEIQEDGTNKIIATSEYEDPHILNFTTSTKHFEPWGDLTDIDISANKITNPRLDEFIEYLNEILEQSINFLSVGPGREDNILISKE